MIEELNPELFIYENYESDFWHRLDMEIDESCDDDVLAFKMRGKVLGWCDASRLQVRPRSDMVAVMCEDEYGKFWFHVYKSTLEKLKE